MLKHNLRLTFRLGFGHRQYLVKRRGGEDAEHRMDAQLGAGRRRRGEAAQEPGDLPRRRQRLVFLRQQAAQLGAARRPQAERNAQAGAIGAAGPRSGRSGRNRSDSRRNRPAGGASSSPPPRRRRARGGCGRCLLFALLESPAELLAQVRQAVRPVPQPVALPDAGRLDDQVARLFEVSHRGDDPLARLADRAADLLQIEREPRATFHGVAEYAPQELGPLGVEPPEDLLRSLLRLELVLGVEGAGRLEDVFQLQVSEQRFDHQRATS